ncbi:hypothetical protein DFH08DRAFT_871782 [Mycena albidolilacea]|uniref:GATA-type domain-containing protein n=1 Tax=Mycena albidolilacea TaxID=1033008 RepID=A0AAD6ZWQ7_9AGAR|nr:hypothetical protein DFH08DRAFT_871782 [Mycena albidolilacea]
MPPVRHFDIVGNAEHAVFYDFGPSNSSRKHVSSNAASANPKKLTSHYERRPRTRPTPPPAANHNSPITALAPIPKKLISHDERRRDARPTPPPAANHNSPITALAPLDNNVSAASSMPGNPARSVPVLPRAEPPVATTPAAGDTIEVAYTSLIGFRMRPGMVKTIRRCFNCNTLKTSVWVRSKFHENKIVCTKCSYREGQSLGTPRATAPTEANSGVPLITYTDVAGVKTSATVRKKCFVCGKKSDGSESHKYSAWRRSIENQEKIVCRLCHSEEQEKRIRQASGTAH